MKSPVTPPGQIGELLMPSGTGIMTSHIRGRYIVEMTTAFNGTLPKNYLIGQQTISYRLSARDTPAEIFGIVLKPTAIWKMTKIPAFHLRNWPIDSQEAFDIEYHPLLQAIDQAEDYPSKLACAILFFEKISQSIDTGLTLVDYALDLIFAKKGCLATRDICRELHISERHLQHLFRIQVGVSPQSYARITRFNAIFTEFAKSNENQDLPFLMSFYNYYDTSHLLKDFKNFCGQAPSQFQLENFKLLKELVEKDPYLTQIQENNSQNTF